MKAVCCAQRVWRDIIRGELRKIKQAGHPFGSEPSQSFKHTAHGEADLERYPGAAALRNWRSAGGSGSSTQLRQPP